MDNSTRGPLKELKNMKPELRAASTPAKKPSGVRRAISKKPSAIPPPPVRRHTITRAKPTENADVPPIPSRLSTKPRRTVTSGFRGVTARANNAAGTTRRSTVVSYTPSAVPSSSLVRSKSKPAQADPKMTKKMDSMFEELRQMKEAMSANQSADDSNKEMRTMLENLKQQLTSSLSERDKLNDHLDEILKLKLEITDLQSKHVNITNLYETEQQRSSSLQEDVEEARERISRLEEERMQRSQLSESQVDEMKQTIHRLTAKNEEISEQNLRLEAQHKAADDAAAQLEKTKESLQRELREASERLAKAEQFVNEHDERIRRLTTESKSFAEEKKALQGKLKARDESASRLETDVQRLTKEVNDVKVESQCQKEQMRDEHNAYKDAITSDLEVLRSKLAQGEKETAALSTDLKSRSIEVNALQQSISSQERTIMQTKAEKHAMGVKIELIESELSGAKQNNCNLTETLRQRDNEIATLERQARCDAAEMRKLRNTIQELKGNIRVFARVRPLLPEEKTGCDSEAAQQLFEYRDMGKSLMVRNPTRTQSASGNAKVMSYPFQFDKVFSPQANQECVFEEISQLVQSALDGYRVCIFAYGQTGSGKTYTMIGGEDGVGRDLGMIPRSVHQVFETAREMQKDDWTITMKASFLEIYNEKLQDLLKETTPVPKQKRRRSNSTSTSKDDTFKIRLDPETNLIVVNDLSKVDVQSEEELNKLISRSMRKRATAATKANERSSRSHCVFRLYITGKNAATGETRSGLLNLIDLAGSERLKHSKAEGARLLETKNINKSLSSLADVIQALSKKEKHVPYRNGKLTHVLQDSLGGNSKTLMFVNISHAVDSFHESLTSLRFAQKVNHCHIGTARKVSRLST